jgi:3-(3-hydroxy-phenyl)propionate hydroxylase
MTINAGAPEQVPAHGLTVPRLALAATPEIAARYLGEAPGAVYLIRPDQHVAARWHRYDEAAVAAALAKALGKE